MKSPSLIAGAGGLALSMLSAIAQTSLKEAFKGDFLIGAALNESQFSETNAAQSALVKSQFNSITAENVMKWEAIHPRQDNYQFGPADRFVDFGEKNGMFIIGHTLVWHSQAPGWLFKDAKGGAVDRETLLARMRDHIHAVVGRYKGRIKGWDVVNEALAEDGSLRESPWLQIIGEDYIAKAFQFAHEADPDAELYYNDYGLEHPAKRKGAVALLEKLRSAGLPVTGVGIQEHVTLAWPTLDELDKAIDDFSELGLKVMITELDVDVLPGSANAGNADVNRKEASNPVFNPYIKGLPADKQQELAQRYAGLFSVYLRHRDTVNRVTLWGLTDGGSWLNEWPIPGRTSHPLLFDRSGKPKPAYDALIETVSRSPKRQTPPAHE